MLSSPAPQRMKAESNRFAGGRPGFHLFDFALGSEPSDGTLPVQARTLEDLHRARTIPEDICLVNIDTGALDLEVIRGMGDHRYPVVVAGFGRRLTPTLESLVEVMSARGYHWYTVLYRVLGRTKPPTTVTIAGPFRTLGAMSSSSGNTMFSPKRRRGVRR